MTVRNYPADVTTASSGNVANGVASATLAATAAGTWMVTGFEITAGGATAAAVVAVTLTGLLGGTATYIFGVPAGATVPAVPLVVEFDEPLAASGPSVAVVLSMPALGAGNTNSAVALHGFVGPQRVL